jgi:hypothetical protein
MICVSKSVAQEEVKLHKIKLLHVTHYEFRKIKNMNTQGMLHLYNVPAMD